MKNLLLSFLIIMLSASISILTISFFAPTKATAAQPSAFTGNQGKGVGNTAPGNQGSGTSAQTAGRAGGSTNTGAGNPGQGGGGSSPPILPTTNPSNTLNPESTSHEVTNYVPPIYVDVPGSDTETKNKSKQKVKKNKVDLDKVINKKNKKEVTKVEKKGDDIILKSDSDAPPTDGNISPVATDATSEVTSSTPTLTATPPIIIEEIPVDSIDTNIETVVITEKSVDPIPFAQSYSPPALKEMSLTNLKPNKTKRNQCQVSFLQLVDMKSFASTNIATFPTCFYDREIKK